MEETLTLDELYLLLEAVNRKEDRYNRFMAAINGIDIDEKPSKNFHKIQMQSEAALAGKDEQEYVLGLIGFEVEADDD